MIIIKVNRKLLIRLTTFSLVSLIVLSAYSYIAHLAAPYKSEPIIYNASGSPDNALVTFLSSKNLTASLHKNVEIFDVSKGSVVRSAIPSKKLQNEVEKYLSGITGMYVKVKAFPDSGYMIRVPLDPPIKVQNQWLSASVDQAIVIFPQDKVPYLLVLDEKSRPLFFTFQNDTTELLDLLNFQLNSSQ